MRPMAAVGLAWSRECDVPVRRTVWAELQFQTLEDRGFTVDPAGGCDFENIADCFEQGLPSRERVPTRIP